MIVLEIDGRPYTGFSNVMVKKNMDTISGGFMFSTSVDKSEFFPIKRGAKCRALIDGNPIVTGYVDNISIAYGKNRHVIRIKGRDKTSDITDSSLLSVKDFNSPIGLVEVIERVLSTNGITDIKVINNVLDLEDFTKGEIVSAKQSQKVFDFLEKYARKRQVLLASDGDGNIVIQRATTTDKAIGVIQHDPNTPNQNNVISASVDYDESERFNNYVVHGQLNPAGLGEMGAPSVGVQDVANQTGVAYDGAIRPSRTLSIVPEQSSDSKTALSRAFYERNVRRGKSESYDVVVQGHYQDKLETQVWTPNQLIKINDLYADIKAERIIKGVVFEYGLETGSTTTLSCVPQETFSIEPEKDGFKTKNTNEGENFVI